MTATIHLIAAARPNFMKVAPLYHALEKEAWCRPILVHTGQHYDVNMSDAFLRDLGLPAPDIHLGVGSGSHAEQTAAVMVAYEKICIAKRPDLTVVVGDVNSTIAATLAAKKLGIVVAHLEAGLRSRDWAMPEEINRLATDAISDILWTPSPDADENLANEGVAPERVVRVGNIMMDSYELMRPRIEQAHTRDRFGLERRKYGVVTLHRPSNVDRKETLGPLVDTLIAVAARVPLVFAVHPRTRTSLEKFGLMARFKSAPGIHLADPMGYIEFMGLVTEAGLAITDSGGIQEETTYLGIPCLTLRENTERPITVSEGTNRLVRLGDLLRHVKDVEAGKWPTGRRPALWDGRAAERIVADLRKRFAKARTPQGVA
jgi:UDP-N-acetylglucosamine 2-epimerase (non-hydrolysing)